jgi:hypothetical protein
VVRSLKGRIERLERRFAVDDEDDGMFLEETYHEWQLTDPEGFRRAAADRYDCAMETS